MILMPRLDNANMPDLKDLNDFIIDLNGMNDDTLRGFGFSKDARVSILSKLTMFWAETLRKEME